MTHDELRDLLGVYALDAVDDAERRLIDDHLAACAECRDEVDRHRSVAALLSEADAAVPAGLWSRVESDLRGRDASAVRTLPRRRWSLPAMSAAAAALVALVGVQTVRLDTAKDRLAAAEQRTAVLEQALAAGALDEVARLAAADPRSRTLALAGEGGGGVVILLPDGTGLLASHNLSPLDPSHTYQLWAVLDGEVISAGLLGADPGVVPFHIDPARLDGLVITQESAGGVAVSAQPPTAAWFPDA